MSEAAAAPALRLPRPQSVATFLTVMAIATVFLVSSKVLQWAGLPYATSGGSALAKFHPATFLSLGSLAAWMVAVGPSRFVGTIAANRPGLVAFAFAIVLLTFQAVVIQHMPVSAVIDTFLMPLALFIGIVALRGHTVGRLVIAMHALFFLNSAIGYVEYFTGFRLTPYYEGGKVITYDWRATALLGHPLNNALLTGIYLIILSGPGGRLFSTPLRTFLLIFNVGAMAAFGGRAATVGALAVLGLRGLSAFMTVLAGRRFARADLIVVVTALTLLAVLGTLAYQGGVVDSFLNRFEDDSGSANTRVVMFHIFDGVSWGDFFLAPDPGQIAANQARLGLAIAIESFVVAFFAYYGVIASILFFAGLVAFSAEIVRLVGPAAILPLVYYFGVSATSTGIANKTIDLAMATSMLLILLDRRFIAARPPPAPTRPTETASLPC